MKKKRNALTHVQFYGLTEWLKSNHEDIKPYTQLNAHSAASKALGTALPYSSVAEASTAAGLSFSRGPVKRKAQQDRLRVLANELGHLYTALGITVPANISALSRGQQVAG
jgi:hypothetical protein